MISSYRRISTQIITLCLRSLIVFSSLFWLFIITCLPEISIEFVSSRLFLPLSKRLWILFFINVIVAAVYWLSSPSSSTNEGDYHIVDDWYIPHDGSHTKIITSDREGEEATLEASNKIGTTQRMLEYPPEDKQVEETFIEIGTIQRKLARADEDKQLAVVECPYTEHHNRHIVPCPKKTANGREAGMAVEICGLVRKSSMDRMDNEQFRVIVENFIAKKKKIIREEHILDLSQKKQKQMNNRNKLVPYITVSD